MLNRCEVEREVASVAHHLASIDYDVRHVIARRALERKLDVRARVVG